MTPRASGAFAFWVLAGALCVSSISVIWLRQAAFYERTEPFYASPIPNPGGVLSLRRDAYGKGTFGASRNGGRKHKGLDFLLPLGRPILAAKSGRVTVSGWDKGYGEWVEIRHPDGLSTRYAHLQRRDVAVSEWVSQGQTIGLCGKTGNADDPRILPHLHFEIRFRTHALNPSEGLLHPDVKIRNT